MSAEKHFDVIVVGGGPVGLSAAWRSAAGGARVLVTDRFGFLNESCGSSGGERHWRVQYTQPDIFRLTLATAPLWKELEADTGRTLVHELGSLWFGDTHVPTNEGHIADTAAAMDELSVPYEWLSGKEIERRYGFRDLPAHFEGFLQPSGGAIDVRGTLAALVRQCHLNGVRMQSPERILAVEPGQDGVVVRSDRATYRADKVVLAANAHVNELIRPWGAGELDLHTYEMALVTLRDRGDGVRRPFWFAFQEPTAEDTNLFYGFPPNPWSNDGLARLGPDFEVDALADADLATGRPRPAHVERVSGWVRAHLPWLDPEPVSTGTCLAVLPGDPQRQFYLGTAEGLVEGGENVVVAAGGWAFKLVPLFGRICADLLSRGKTEHDIARHALTGLRAAVQ
ncbi:FAD-dependent oxidoreductase [Amycolatopsis rubida]|uniref:FAD-dependent oxidoreductase n=1 Tax=Amycolatopsis rubida TaxID=112413 RepID=A0ABX0C3G4_9PSEU|nr:MULTISPECIES: FAD-dependent oxidoreductase [Amycolatopsis]MYW97329.1 FAD-dependent oxidoreductase [Amycolatopsis rubida]NEC62314.1 FAD-dependent oxidoreductase [Amycolatopsis rubida]OAP20672.1 Monomeric sarcosine oxidase [Amycolatopsis sp. M39]